MLKNAIQHEGFYIYDPMQTSSKVEDVDLFIGMLAENPVPPARVGPVLACLLADQFLRLKWGDRFWYENDVYFHHFTECMKNFCKKI